MPILEASQASAARLTCLSVNQRPAMAMVTMKKVKLPLVLNKHNAVKTRVEWRYTSTHS
jgi:hypothetical protein